MYMYDTYAYIRTYLCILSLSVLSIDNFPFRTSSLFRHSILKDNKNNNSDNTEDTNDYYIRK
jgi:hypothetical protein